MSLAKNMQPHIGAATRPKRGNEPVLHPRQATKRSDNPNFAEELLELRNIRITKRQAYRKKLRSGLIRACEIGVAMKKNVPAWEAFIAAKWGKLKPPKIDDRNDAVRWAIKFWMGEGKENQKKASFYFSAVGPLIEKDFDASKLAKKIKTVGLKELQKRHTAKKKKSGASTVSTAEPATKVRNPTLQWSFDATFAKEPIELLQAKKGRSIHLTGKLAEVGSTARC